MNPEDLATVEATLKSIAVGHGLGWVIEQTEEVIREGKSAFKHPQGKAERDIDELVPAAITKQRGVLETQPYSLVERAELYTEALGRVIEDAAAAEEYAAELLLDGDLVESVVFVDELDGQATHSLEDDRDAMRRATESRERLLETLAKLKQRLPA